MKDIFLHIGTHKTGTTTIQESLSLNAARLMSNGIYLPLSGRLSTMNAGQHNLAWEINEDSRFQKEKGTWRDLFAEIASHDFNQIILSSEDFSLLRKDRIETLRNLLSEFKVHILVYLRRQDLYLQSFWAEIINNWRYYSEFDDFPIWLIKNNYQYKNSNYLKFLENWSDVFGRNSIVVRVLERQQLSGNLFNDFLTSCGVRDPNQYQISQDKNQSPGIKSIILLQELKKRLNGKLNLESRISLISLIREYSEINEWNKETWNFIDSSIFKKIDELYAASNRQVANVYLGREQLFLEPFQDMSTTSFTIDEFRREELLDVFCYVFSRLGDERLEQKKQIDLIYASRGWQALEKLRKYRSFFRDLVRNLKSGDQ